MMDSLWMQLVIVCPMVFLAGFADSIAGGGGIISIPAYLLAGIPVHAAYGTNKFAMSLGTAISAVKYYRAGQVKIKSAAFAAVGALIGSNLGANLAMLIDEKYLQIVLIILLPIIAVFLMLNKGFGSEKTLEEPMLPRKEYTLSALIGLAVGAYDGFFGPGAGTFYMMLFVSMLHYDLLTSSGNARVVNLASNVGALVAYVIGGKVMFQIGIPAAACAIAGNALGSALAIKNGAKFIRPVMAVVIVLLLIKIVLDFM